MYASFLARLPTLCNNEKTRVGVNHLINQPDIFFWSTVWHKGHHSEEACVFQKAETSS